METILHPLQTHYRQRALRCYNKAASAHTSERKGAVLERIAVIPAFEPPATLVGLASQAAAAFSRVIIVNDGSEQEYQSIFDEASSVAHVIQHSTNAGKGAALKTAFRYLLDAKTPSDATVVTLDADGQHTVADALRVCEASEQLPQALILGSRNFSDVPTRSRMGNGFMRFTFKLQTGNSLSDTQTGLRAFSAAMLEQMIAIEGNRYEYEMNVLLRCASAHIPLVEVPISTIYLDDTNSNSHYITFKDSALIGKELLKFSVSSAASFLIDYALYTVLLLLLGNGFLVFCNICARCVSATVNFTINRLQVFKAKNSVWKSALQYACLALCILALNTTVLWLLVTNCGLNPFATKIVVELCLFAISWLVQRNFIFKDKESSAH